MILLVVALVLCGIGALLYQWHRSTEPPESRSPTVSARAAAATTALDTRLAAVTAAAPGLHTPATAVHRRGQRLLRQQYGPVACTRTLTRYLAADGADHGVGHARR
ncbi:hypothetical protein [Spirilliplanes yamanashiensis]|uniref:hypothetical protein n=1 Tax=Spirilliplanes yamanashiensis TaxID=42233 RepID=UPI00194FC798|nr:hypothetical protein [Spirilliplanes yamanashiensis]MDP9817040.1 Na+-transporting methylmalonyl-CoA/oxaloacetate decarboxylase gamma subunit [Spirilliplanes yamanashiensis]